MREREGEDGRREGERGGREQSERESGGGEGERGRGEGERVRACRWGQWLEEGYRKPVPESLHHTLYSVCCGHNHVVRDVAFLTTNNTEVDVEMSDEEWG